MDTIEFLKEAKRMCDCYNACSDCLAEAYGEKLSCIRMIDCDKFSPQLAFEIVENWSKEHPEKTRLQDFMEKFPNAPLGKLQYPWNFGPVVLGYCNGRTSCDGCKYATEKSEFCWNLSLDEKV